MWKNRTSCATLAALCGVVTARGSGGSTGGGSSGVSSSGGSSGGASSSGESILRFTLTILVAVLLAGWASVGCSSGSGSPPSSNCKSDGVACVSSSECCGVIECLGGICGGGSRACRALGDSCSDTSECCGDAICPHAANPVCTTCKPLGSACNLSLSECCGYGRGPTSSWPDCLAPVGDNGICTAPSAGCKGVNEACSSSNECCGSATCSGGVCSVGAGDSGTRDSAEACTESGWTSSSNPYAPGGNPYVPAACSANSDCCSGSYCVSGVLNPPSQGYCVPRCTASSQCSTNCCADTSDGTYVCQAPDGNTICL